MKQATRGYETFHKLPAGTATTEQVENTSAGIQGFANYMDAEIEAREYAEEAESTVASDRTHIDLLTRLGTNSISVVGPKTEEWEESKIIVVQGHVTQSCHRGCYHQSSLSRTMHQDVARNMRLQTVAPFQSKARSAVS